MNSLADQLHRHVTALATDIGPRGVFAPDALSAAADYIDEQLDGMGYTVRREPVASPDGPSHNLIVEHPGTDPAIWLLAAHYDTVATTPGADDNASAVAVLLELARTLKQYTRQSLRFAFLTNEEAPYFGTAAHGAVVHAEGCAARGEQIVLMVALEMVGYYTAAPGSQHYPQGLEGCGPGTGDFIALIGSPRHRKVLTRLDRAFKAASELPSVALSPKFWMPSLVRSDHFAFWQRGFPVALVTDTADFRNPHYHGPHDTPDILDYTAMAQLTSGLTGAIQQLAGPVP